MRYSSNSLSKRINDGNHDKKYAEICVVFDKFTNGDPVPPSLIAISGFSVRANPDAELR
jgi:hypothetical protein